MPNKANTTKYLSKGAIIVAGKVNSIAKPLITKQ